MIYATYPMMLRFLALYALIAASPVHAVSSPKQIAINASGTFFSVYRDSGISGAVLEITNCYDAAKTRDAYLFCVAMDTQASRLDASVSSELGYRPLDYFAEADFGERIGKLQTWYPSKSQLDYTINQLMDGLEAGMKAELQRLEQK